jgi:soluble lytic murein transglycosylase-like protein
MAQPQTMSGYQTPIARNPQAPVEEIPTDISALINQAAQQYGIPPELLFDIAFSESGFNPQAQNPDSSAAGLFQFTDPTWLDVLRMAQTPDSGLNLEQGATPLDPQAAALVAAYLISQGQLGRWGASQGGWGQFYSPEELAPYLGVR